MYICKKNKYIYICGNYFLNLPPPQAHSEITTLMRLYIYFDIYNIDAPQGIPEITPMFIRESVFKKNQTPAS